MAILYQSKYQNIRIQLQNDPKFKKELEDRLPDIEHTIQILQTEYNAKILQENKLKEKLKRFSYFQPKTQQQYDEYSKDTSRILKIKFRLEDCQEKIQELIPIYKETINSPSTPATLGGKRKTRRNRKSKKSKKRKSYKKRI